MQCSRWCGLAGAGVVWVLVLVGVNAAEPWPSLGGKMTVAEERIQKALTEDTRLEFIETPLNQVVDFLKDQHAIPIEIDNKSLDAIGVGSDSPVTKNLKGISLASALRLILRDLDLTYVIENEVLLITTCERAEASAQVRVYNVAPLLKAGLTAEDLAVALRDVLGTSSPFAPPGGPVCGGPPPAREPVRRIVPLRHLLLVRDTSVGHREVAELIGALAEGLREAPQPPK